MQPARFDAISKLFTNRRQVIAASAGLAATAFAGHTHAQDATPAADEIPAVPADPVTDKTMYLFVQSFQGGSLSPAANDTSRATLNLGASTGQTVYFGDRPSRDVGVVDTPTFLDGLGFSEDNPPNAAVIIEAPDGDTSVAVLELFAPTYDPITGGVTYEVEPLAEWEQNLELGFQELPVDLAALPTEFSSAHLLIDDCADQTIVCGQPNTWPVGSFTGVGYCTNWTYFQCQPCEGGGDHSGFNSSGIFDYWQSKCNETFPDCDGNCVPTDTGNWFQ